MADTTASENELPDICVVIPMYKAERTILNVLSTIPKFVSNIIVVDDCSPDNSYECAKKFTDSRVHFVRHAENQGVGGAVLSGYRRAIELGADIIVKMDSDYQMDPDYLLALIHPIVTEEADYSKGNRFLHSQALAQMPALRRIGNLALSFLTKISSGYWDIFDPTNGYTAIHSSLIPTLNQKAISRRFFFETSMLLELSSIRAVVRDVAIPARYLDEDSNLSEYHALLSFPLPLLKGFVKRIWGQYFVRDFGILSLSLITGLLMLGFGILFGAYQWLHAFSTQSFTPSGTVMLAALPVILGVQFLLQTIILDVQNQPKKPLFPQLSWINRIRREKERFLGKAVNQ